jgi:hypothetical protein
MKYFTNTLLMAGCIFSAKTDAALLTLDIPPSPKKDVAVSAAAAPSVTETYAFTGAPLPLEVPDGVAVPVSDTRKILASEIFSITSIEISVQLANPAQAGAYNGDYYLSLQHSSGFSVLLNRVGRRDGTSPAELLGYGDNGFNVTFRDDAPLGDIHNYRLSLEGSHTVPIDPTYTQPLTGVWAPDGRETSPLTVFNYDNRTALLSSFNTLAANGDWTLEAVDFNSGGVAKIDGWSIKVTGIVPEPVTIGWALGLGLAWALLRRKQ